MTSEFFPEGVCQAKQTEENVLSGRSMTGAERHRDPMFSMTQGVWRRTLERMVEANTKHLIPHELLVFENRTEKGEGGTPVRSFCSDPE